MILPKHVIISSYFVKPEDTWAEWLRQSWCMNVMRHAPETRCIIISQANIKPIFRGPNEQWIYLSGDLGHIGQHVSGEKKFRHSGYTATLIAGLMLAYADESDAIFLEQDAFAFGGWKQKLYEDAGKKGLVFGSCRLMGAAQSLFLVKHWFIPEFVRRYMEHGDTEILGEHKFSKMENETPHTVGRFSFPYDRDRPINPELPVFYAQKLKPSEIELLASRQLMSKIGMPDAKVFSNCE